MQKINTHTLALILSLQTHTPYNKHIYMVLKVLVDVTLKYILAKKKWQKYTYHCVVGGAWIIVQGKRWP